MKLTHRELWTAVHGMILGAAFLLLFGASLVGLCMLKPNLLTADGARICAKRTAAATWLMAIFAFAAAGVGTYLIYPWYRAVPPLGLPNEALAQYPKYLLLSSAQTSGWHEFGMEWKEHIAWLAPMLTTAVAYSIGRLGAGLASQSKIRRLLMILLTTSFFCAVVAGLLGALINKAAPIR